MTLDLVQARIAAAFCDRYQAIDLLDVVEILCQFLGINWKERPGTGCIRYDKTGDAVTVIDATSGKVRAKIVKTAQDNAEKLKP